MPTSGNTSTAARPASRIAVGGFVLSAAFALASTLLWLDPASAVFPWAVVGLGFLGLLVVRRTADTAGSPRRDDVGQRSDDHCQGEVVRDLAAQAGLVLHNVRLNVELRASRQRLVAAQEEERRRIERNIHDGAQQQLVALAVKLRLAEQLTEREPAGRGRCSARSRSRRPRRSRISETWPAGCARRCSRTGGLHPPSRPRRGSRRCPSGWMRDGIGRHPPDVETAV